MKSNSTTFEKYEVVIDKYNYVAICEDSGSEICNPCIMSVKQFKSGIMLVAQYNAGQMCLAYYENGIYVQTTTAGDPVIVYGIR